MEKEFDLEYQYQLYLKRVALKENNMNSVQKIETKRAFMGACGQMLFLLRDDISKFDEDEAIEILENIKNQIGNFFIKQKGLSN